ncbi:MAG: OsmC family peroxiredoxin [Proteobacteria bacterium]|nr:MAG: OsmC family peroxiredoxin [Pseudomonadota bacterium]
MVTYPLHFEVSANGPGGVETPWRTGTEHTDRYTEAAIPPEFKGPGGGFSPEDLYAMALLNCYLATFKVLAQNSKLAYEEVSAKGRLTVDRDEAGKPWMSHMGINVQLRLAKDGDRARADMLLKKTAQNCLILNSVRTEKSFEFSVS